MDLRTQTSLFAGVIALAIGIAVLLRARNSDAHWAFAPFSASVAGWYLSTSLVSSFGPTPGLMRTRLLCAVLLPVAAARFLLLFLGRDLAAAAWLWRPALLLGAALVACVFSPAFRSPWLSAAIFVYMFVLFFAALGHIFRRGSQSASRFQRARVRFLVAMGALSGTFTAVDYLPLVGLDIPPVGTVLTLVFLYILAQSVLRDRLVDLYEVAGRIAVLTALSFLLAGVFWVLTAFSDHTSFVHSVAAALSVLLVYDPVRQKVEDKISQLFFRERFDLEQQLANLRTRLLHVLELRDLPDLLLLEIERSRRVTHAALYLLDDDMRGYVLHGHLGSVPVRRLERAAVRPLLDVLRREPALKLETMEARIAEHRARHHDREAETCHEVAQTLEAMHASLCVALTSDREVFGFFCVRDERLRDAFSPEEVQLFMGLGNQVVTTVENSRVYLRMKERDRLVAMGEMAAGLAHEIRNPLGAIKASAQYLAETPRDDTGAAEFLDIIVEEADRLNRVLTSFLEYASPTRGDTAAPCNVNAVIERTVLVLGLDETRIDLTRTLKLGADIPNVLIDAERLRQVLINLIQNALQAIELGGTLSIETALSDNGGVEHPNSGAQWVEIRVRDTGHGVPEQVVQRLFEPFVSTKQRGTGLGLAISQRIVTSAGGRIVVQTRENQGSTFTVLLPVAGPAAAPEVDAAPAFRDPGDPAESGARELPNRTSTRR